MSVPVKDKRIYLGSIYNDSGIFLLTDPSYLKSFVNNDYSTDAQHKKEFSFAGACHAANELKGAGTLSFGQGVAVKAFYGEGGYDVFGIVNQGNQITRIIIPLDNFPDMKVKGNGLLL